MSKFTKKANRYGRTDGPTNPNHRKALLLKRELQQNFCSDCQRKKTVQGRNVSNIYTSCKHVTGFNIEILHWWSYS